MSSINSSLTIAIPTYNRHKTLQISLKLLVANLPDSCEILVVDNCSTPPVIDEISPDLILKKIRILRNSVNIGGNSNILRCVEHCTTPYIWILGDDDYIEPDALEKVLSLLAQNPAWINFCSRDIHQPTRTGSSSHASLEEFLASLKSINELVFVSNNVFRTEFMKSGIQVGLQYQSTMAPHVVSMLEGLSSNPSSGPFLIVDEELFSSISNNSDTATTWPLYQAFIGIISLYQIPFSGVRPKDIIRLTRGARKGWLRNRFLFSAMRSLADKVGKKQAILIATSMLGPLIVIDGLAVISTVCLIFIAILFGEFVGKIFKRFKK